ncbi:Uncharacterized conserved protein, DUF1800 family [Roseomonas rosea]|uniref:Uncharacterized conserved protein, DUF1800 family n=1 Tax=Muricoccus roseus TaxID=198092 RepID=A0A1M6AC12_9PROT|nr:DUF1800 domain-containing protein [Roseomonas rosea]SHI33961.1 Uncharacterized conserved protein, DUF1800 family [Roseomonas rosea]
MAANAAAALTAVQRFGLGAGPGDLNAAARDPRGWVASAIGVAGQPPEPSEAPRAEDGLRLFLTRREVLRTARPAAGAAPMANGMAADPPAKPSFVGPGEVLGKALTARLETAIRTPAPLEERLAAFWMDHFTASASAGFTGYFLDAYEREAIRPHLFGRFAEMARAAVLHPAMLFYLDNRNSTGPGSRMGQSSRGRRGLNENLAREALELHTLGVDGGYTQDDVIAFAKVLTGWSVDVAPDATGDRLGFFAGRHEPGPKTVLGRTYPQDGPDQAVAVLNDLARHPATARHVARRMVRHFVGHGLPGLEARIAEVFRRSEGDLGAVTRALIADDEAWGPPRKVRSPVELLMATARLMGGLQQPPPARRVLIAMGQPFWAPPSPKGWPIEDDAWAAPDAIKTRLDWASELAARAAPHTDARALLDTAFGSAASAETRRAVERAADGRQALTLLVLSPEFQRR